MEVGLVIFQVVYKEKNLQEIVFVACLHRCQTDPIGGLQTVQTGLKIQLCAAEKATASHNIESG